MYYITVAFLNMIILTKIIYKGQLDFLPLIKFLNSLTPPELGCGKKKCKMYYKSLYIIFQR